MLARHRKIIPNARMKNKAPVFSMEMIESRYPRAANRIIPSTTTTMKKALDLFIMIASPTRSSREVANSGYARTSAPTRNETTAHVQGIRNIGARNMQNPVAIPSGGTTIFRTVTALRPSRTRHTITAANPARDATTDTTGEITAKTSCRLETRRGMGPSYSADGEACSKDTGRPALRSRVALLRKIELPYSVLAARLAFRATSNSSPASHSTLLGCPLASQPSTSPNRASLAFPLKSQSALYSSEGWW